MNREVIIVKRKDGILHSAIEIIDERGFHGFTIRELSKRQNISEAAIYRHFNNKNDILKSLLEHYSDYYNKICETIKTENMSALQAINFYITSYYEYYENYPEMISLLI
jgi:AcrR family transcriptional regulator